MFSTGPCTVMSTSDPPCRRHDQMPAACLSYRSAITRSSLPRAAVIVPSVGTRGVSRSSLRLYPPGVHFHGMNEHSDSFATAAEDTTGHQPDHQHDHQHDHQSRGQGHHAMGGLNSMAASATLHCLTGCAIGEVAGLMIGTAIGLGNGGTIAISIALAFFFGYTLSTVPLLKAGLTVTTALSVVLAADTLSILTMEVV